MNTDIILYLPEIMAFVEATAGNNSFDHSYNIQVLQK